MLFFTGGVKFVISNESVYRGQISEAVSRDGVGTRRTINILRLKAEDSEFAPRGGGRAREAVVRDGMGTHGVQVSPLVACNT